MNKNLLKKISIPFLISIPIVAFILYFCNNLCVPFLNQIVQKDNDDIAQILGDRGGAHLPDVEIILPKQNWFFVLVCALAFISLACIVLLIILKIRTNNKQSEVRKNLEENKGVESAKSTSLKQIVARNLENDKKEYEKIDNPKH